MEPLEIFFPMNHVDWYPFEDSRPIQTTKINYLLLYNSQAYQQSQKRIFPEVNLNLNGTRAALWLISTNFSGKP